MHAPSVSTSTIGAPIRRADGSAPPNRITHAENGAHTTKTAVHTSAAAPPCERASDPFGSDRKATPPSKGPTKYPPHHDNSGSNADDPVVAPASPESAMHLMVSVSHDMLRQAQRHCSQGRRRSPGCGIGTDPSRSPTPPARRYGAVAVSAAFGLCVSLRAAPDSPFPAERARGGGGRGLPAAGSRRLCTGAS